VPLTVVPLTVVPLTVVLLAGVPLGGVLLAVVGGRLTATDDAPRGVAWLPGAAVRLRRGLALWHAAFSFAGAYRRALTAARTAGIRA